MVSWRMACTNTCSKWCVAVLSWRPLFCLDFSVFAAALTVLLVHSAPSTRLRRPKRHFARYGYGFLADGVHKHLLEVVRGCAFVAPAFLFGFFSLCRGADCAFGT